MDAVLCILHDKAIHDLLPADFRQQKKLAHRTWLIITVFSCQEEFDIFNSLIKLLPRGKSGFLDTENYYCEGLSHFFRL